jgi:glyoxylase-like metal-dependent hydrolase (beta-lactamase superfamily II)
LALIFYREIFENESMQNENLRIETKAVEPFMKNGYIVSCPDTKKAVYIDPGDEAQLMIDWLIEQGLELEAIFNTHGHLDHISGNLKTREHFDVPIYLHQEDLFIYDSLSEQSGWFGLKYDPAPPVDHYFRDKETHDIGRLKFRVHHTPGHSPGSVTLEVNKHLFCGDLIFAGAIGRTDLPGGSYPLIIQSIRERILPLGDELTLMPGHGPSTTVGVEVRSNPFLNDI